MRETHAFQGRFLGEVIARRPGMRQAEFEHLSCLRGLADSHHGEAQVADDVPLALGVAELASDRQRRFERLDRPGGIAFAHEDHSQVRERSGFLAAVAGSTCRGQQSLCVLPRVPRLKVYLIFWLRLRDRPRTL